jgi:cell division protein FtsB
MMGDRELFTRDSRSMASGQDYRERWGQRKENAPWPDLLEVVADEIVDRLRPRRVLEVSCGSGMLLRRLRSRGIDAWGLESEETIREVPSDIRSFCMTPKSRDADAPFDLTICLNALEKIPDRDGTFLRGLTASSSRLLFSSIPPTADAPVHGNARPTLEWIGLLGGYGFAPNLSFDATFAAPHAMLLERGTRLASEVERMFSECIDRRYQAAFEGGSDNGPEACARYRERAAILEAQLIREREYLETLRGTHAFLVQEVQQLRERPVKLGADLPDLAAIVEAVRSQVFVAGPPASTSQVLEDAAELRAEIGRLERRTNALERSVQSLARVVDGVIHSRIWQSLIKAGGVILRLTGRSDSQAKVD